MCPLSTFSLHIILSGKRQCCHLYIKCALTCSLAAARSLGLSKSEPVPGVGSSLLPAVVDVAWPMRHSSQMVWTEITDGGKIRPVAFGPHERIRPEGYSCYSEHGAQTVVDTTLTPQLEMALRPANPSTLKPSRDTAATLHGVSGTEQMHG